MAEKPHQDYSFYVPNPQGGLMKLPVNAIGPKGHAAQLAEMVYQQLVQKMGLGALRPTAYSVTPILDLPKQAKKRPLLVVPRNGELPKEGA